MQRSRPKIVAVDGPAGSGKSSICYQVAQRVGWTYINTGALYRAVGLIAARKGVNLSDEQAVADMVSEITKDLRWHDRDRALIYRDQDLTPLLGTEEAGDAASKVAKLGLVRTALLPAQKGLTLSAPIGALVDGRDIGTVVFPDADLKIFLTATLEERSMRRLRQLEKKGASAGRDDHAVLQDIMRGIADRDERDAARAMAPLKCADDAVTVDSSGMDVHQTIEAIIQMMRDKGLVE